MEDLDKIITSLEEKEKTSFDEMGKLLDSIDNIISDTNKELSESNNKDESNTKNILMNNESKLRKLKLIPKVNHICNSYYHKYKELNKKIDDNIKDTNYLSNKNMTKFIGNIDEKLIKEIIIDHLIRQGNIETVKKFIEENKLDLALYSKDIQLFKEYYEILNDLNNHSVQKLNEWCIKNKAILLKDIEEINTVKKKEKNGNEKNEENKNIFFECIKYTYILYLEDSNKTVQDCIEFCRQNFKPFITNKICLDEISKLMSRMLFKKIRNDENETNLGEKYANRYEKIDAEKGLEYIKNLFIDYFFKLNHKTKDDNLNIILLAGRYALPQVVEAEEKLAKDKDKKNLEVDKEKNQLMYSLELPEELVFHNIFVCPVSKEISSVENEPIRLNCGHCICKNSFDKIEKTGARHNQIKCPICTQVCKVDEIITLKI